jgi:hypothetical protein
MGRLKEHRSKVYIFFETLLEKFFDQELFISFYEDYVRNLAALWRDQYNIGHFYI